MNKIGDGVVGYEAQQGGNFNVDGGSNLINLENEWWGPDVMDTKHPSHHTNTPDLGSVISIINQKISY